MLLKFPIPSKRLVLPDNKDTAFLLPPGPDPSTETSLTASRPPGLKPPLLSLVLITETTANGYFDANVTTLRQTGPSKAQSCQVSACLNIIMASRATGGSVKVLRRQAECLADNRRSVKSAER